MAMLDAVDARDLLRKSGFTGLQGEALASFLQYLEKKLHARFVYDGATIPFHKPELVDLFILAGNLQSAGVIRHFMPVMQLPDEPQIRQWYANVASDIQSTTTLTATGSTVYDDRTALTIALAESVERHVWATRNDYAPQRRGTLDAMRRTSVGVLDPDTFVGLSPTQRNEHSELKLSHDQEYLWMRGRSLITQKPLWIPAQTVSGRPFPGEPLIREQNSTGSATQVTDTSALLGGILELVERDAFMITWLNQLTPHQLDLREIALQSTTLTTLLRKCEQYRLQPIGLRLITDAPTYVVGIVLEDLSGVEPRLSLGLKAHHNLAVAIEGALLEALGMRQSLRRAPDDDMTKHQSHKLIDAMGRRHYWAKSNRHEKLSFLTAGSVQHTTEPWERDTSPEHLDRLITWCRINNYECTAVSLTSSKGNPTPWKIERVIIPALQPMYLKEQFPHAYGPRLTTVPKLLGFKPRTKSFLDEPHPFA